MISKLIMINFIPLNIEFMKLHMDEDSIFYIKE